MERDLRRSEQMKRAATNDRDRAAEVLKKQEADLARVLTSNEDINKRMKEAVNRLADYKAKVDKLMRQFTELKREADRLPKR